MVSRLHFYSPQSHQQTIIPAVISQLRKPIIYPGDISVIYGAHGSVDVLHGDGVDDFSGRDKNM